MKCEAAQAPGSQINADAQDQSGKDIGTVVVVLLKELCVGDVLHQNDHSLKWFFSPDRCIFLLH